MIDKYGINREEYLETKILQLTNGQYIYDINIVSHIIKRHRRTIQNWYRWWEEQEIKTKKEFYLPPYIFIYVYGQIKNKYWFRYEDIDKLIKFRDQITYGLLAPYHRNNCWGERGHRIHKYYGTTFGLPAKNHGIKLGMNKISKKRK